MQEEGCMDALKTGKLISEARKEKGLTQAQLADLLHISNTAVSKYEHGARFPDVSLLEDLADVLGISVSELISGEHQTVADQQEQAVRKVVRETRNQEEERRNHLIRNSLIGIFIALILGMIMMTGIIRTHPVLKRIDESPAHTAAAYSAESPNTQFTWYWTEHGTVKKNILELYQDPKMNSSGNYRFQSFRAMVNEEDSGYWSGMHAWTDLFDVNSEAEEEGIPMNWADEIKADDTERILGIDAEHSLNSSLEQLLESGDFTAIITVRYGSQ